MLGFELDAFLTGLQPNGRYYGRPTDADKQSIGAGHIGHSIGCVPRVFPGSPREIHIDGILRQHGDQREKRDRQCLRNIFLGQLSGPGQHESGAEDCNARAQRFEVGSRMSPGEMDNNPLKTKQR